MSSSPRKRAVPPGVLIFLDTCALWALATAINQYVPLTEPILPSVRETRPTWPSCCSSGKVAFGGLSVRNRQDVHWAP